MKQLTDNMIKNAFDELAVDNKYFDKFKESCRTFLFGAAERLS